MTRYATIVEIIDAALTATGVSLEDLVSPRRTAPIVRTRELVAVLALRDALLSAAEIGRHIGTSHSTILYAARRLEARLVERDTDAVRQFAAAQSALNALLSGRPRLALAKEPAR